jgi:hypothetical protein
MEAQRFDAITRIWTRTPRRRVLGGLAGSALGALATVPQATEAAGTCRKRIKKMCAEFRLDCRVMAGAYCSFKFPNDFNQRVACENNLYPCCDPLSSCDVRTNHGCLLEKFV